ncbi:MAG: peptidoglycan DD-metalloendopeptidase family protein, partial [Lachnospiraceae bacterium]
IGTYLCVTLGDEYQAIIGNMDNVSVAEGDYVLKGTVLGGLAEPTKYYVTEGPNLYFELQKNGEPVDPLDYLE